MPFGSLIASHRQVGVRPAGLRPPIIVNYLCDGGSTPNPGAMKRVVHDGLQFERSAKLIGTNHKAVYESIFKALKNARRLKATEVHLSLISRLVWLQVTGNGGARLLLDQRNRACGLASAFPSVTWHLISGPFSVPQGIAPTARHLRRMAP